MHPRNQIKYESNCNVKPTKCKLYSICSILSMSTATCPFISCNTESFTWFYFGTTVLFNVSFQFHVILNDKISDFALIFR